MDRDYQAKLREEAYGDSKEIIAEELAEVQEFDMGQFPKNVKHNWVKRGCVVSCENAGHPNHRHFIKSSSTDLTRNS